jgi:3-hydroxybutyryl-CoA dehydrogenase
VRIAVVGAGIMGSGIAQISAMHGHQVALVDRGDAELERGISAVHTSLARFRKAGKLDQPSSDGVIARIAPTTDVARAVAGAELVVEAVPEVLELKHEVLSEAAAAAPSSAVLASNTSQLSITELGECLGDQADRFLGLHFFNPAVLMPLVELVVGAETSPRTVDVGRAYAESIGKEVVTCHKDMTGFITTRAYAALRLEAIRILEDGVASASDIDKALRLGFNFPMGPLELGDFNGLDTFFYAASSLERAYGDRFSPPATLRRLMDEGHVGRKAGQGFYSYDADGKRVEA